MSQNNSKDSPKEKSESRLLKRLSFWKGSNKAPGPTDFEIVRNDQPEQWTSTKRLTLVQNRIVFDQDGEVVQTERTQSLQTSTACCCIRSFVWVCCFVLVIIVFVFAKWKTVFVLVFF